MKKQNALMVMMVVMMVVLGVYTSAMSADLVLSQYADSVATYNSTTGATGKINYLVGLINSNNVKSHGAFYEIMRTAEEEDLLYIGSALKQAKGPAVLLNLGPYLESIRNMFLAEAAKKPNMNILEREEFQKKANKTMALLQGNIESLLPQIAVVAKKNPQALIAALKKTFSDEGANDSDLAGPVLGIASMGEDGAVLVLKSFGKNGKGEPALSLLCKTLGPYMVIPAVKQNENPSSTPEEKDIANLAIFILPDVEPVYDKVVEAYLHGRYFQAPELKKDKDGKAVLSLEEIIGEASSWWRNLIKSKYKKVEGFVPYVAENYLAKEDGQEKIIELLADVNFGEAAPYFMELNVANLSEGSLSALIQACQILPSLGLSDVKNTGEEKEYKVEKFKIFELLFKALGESARRDRQMIYSLPNYLPRNQAAFVRANVGIMTEEEKKTVVFLCGGSTSDMLHAPLPATERKIILDTLRQGASPELSRIIDYMLKQ